MSSNYGEFGLRQKLNWFRIKTFIFFSHTGRPHDDFPDPEVCASSEAEKEKYNKSKKRGQPQAGGQRKRRKIAPVLTSIENQALPATESVK